MKTIEEIKQTVSENRGYTSWDLLKEDYIFWDLDRLDKVIDDLVTLYSSQYEEKVKVLEAKVEIYKELIEKFVPEEKREVADK